MLYMICVNPDFLQNKCNSQSLKVSLRYYYINLSLIKVGVKDADIVHIFSKKTKITWMPVLLGWLN